MVVTVPERKTREVARLRDASTAAIAHLTAYAARHNGRFTIFGSFARGDIIHTSDFDVLITFPAAAEAKARMFVERVCERVGLIPDVVLGSEVSEALMVRIRRDGVSLP